MTTALTLAGLAEDIEKLSVDAVEKLNTIKKEDFTSPLDFIHDQAKLIGYVDRMDQAKVLIGKSKVVEEFSLLLKIEMDAQTKQYIDARKAIPDITVETIDAEKNMIKRGTINGKILAVTHLGVIISSTDNTLAKELVIKLGKDSPIG